MWAAPRLRLALLRDTPVRRALSTHRSRSTPLGPRGSINRPKPIQSALKASQPESQPEASTTAPTDAPNPSYDPAHNTLLSPVHLPEDPNAVLKENHPATNLLANSGLVVQRQLEMMTVMVYVYYCVYMAVDIMLTTVSQWFRASEQICHYGRAREPHRIHG